MKDARFSIVVHTGLQVENLGAISGIALCALRISRTVLDWVTPSASRMVSFPPFFLARVARRLELSDASRNQAAPDEMIGCYSND